MNSPPSNKQSTNNRPTNSRLWVNIGLFIFLMSAFYIAYQKNTQTQQVIRLTTLNVGDISDIKIPREPEKNSLHFKKQDDIWYMTQPYQLKAHQFRINTLLGLSQAIVNKSYDIKSLKLEDYALDKPRARIKFNHTEIAFGKTNSLNGLRYILAENKLMLAKDKIYPLVNAQASSFIDLSLLPDDFMINKISTPLADIFYTGKQWQSTGEIDLNADQIQSLLQSWRSAKAFAIHKYLARKQLGNISIYSETQAIVFEISDEDPWLILALPELNIEYHLDKSQKNLLFGTINKDENDA